MSKRVAAQTYICKPCKATYDTQAQLMRHKEDRHGAQMSCTLCPNQSFIVPLKRTDNMRRHLENIHGMPKLQVEAVKSYFLPYFEEAATPVVAVAVKSMVTVPRKEVVTSPPVFEPVQLDFESQLPGEIEEFLTADRLDSPPPPQPSLEACLPPPPQPSLEACLPPPPQPSQPLPSQEASLPDLELDWLASRPTLAMPVRYVDSQDQVVPDHHLAQEQEVPDTPANPASPPPPAVGIANLIPLESKDLQADIYFHASMPKAKPDRTKVISAICSGPAPEFPPRRVRVQSRGSLDPRLLFRDAPSTFLPGALAGLVARQRRDIVRQADLEQIKVEFGCQDGVIFREETVSLADGRMATLKSSVLLRDSIKISRSTQTQTD